MTLGLVFLLATSLPESLLEVREHVEWSVSPFPNGHDFGFTIVHDADDSSSRRLFPLFEVFDELGMKLTVTVFPFWAQGDDKRWIESKETFRGPLPLSVPEELEFYRQIEKNGHEIGLHTASDGPDTRTDIGRSFEYFNSAFGHYPAVYVEHRTRDNPECLQEQGADPESGYYVLDILNRYGPWVWVISPSALPYGGWGKYFDVLSRVPRYFSSHMLRLWGMVKEIIKTGQWAPKSGDEYITMLNLNSPFDAYVRKKYGLHKAFRRSGRSDKADGEGFAQWYSAANVDQLQKDRGLALVYTHLNTRWLDPMTGRMADRIKDRLKYISSKDVWFAPAGVILDRMSALSGVSVVSRNGWLQIINNGKQEITGLTILSHRGTDVCKGSEKLSRSERNEIVIGDIKAGETLLLKIEDRTQVPM